MATVILVRHGRTTANSDGVLAGRTPGVLLDALGAEQADAVADRLSALSLATIVSSPQERCRQTARAIAARQPQALRVRVDKGLSECDYGRWQGRALKELAKERLWRTVQTQPSAARFPDGESMREMQDRAVAAVRRHDAAVASTAGDDAVWVACSHGDVIKAVLADALGTHLDLFQRIGVDPASVSIVRYAEARPTVLGVNTHAGGLEWLAPPKRGRRGRRTSDAPVGGGAGPGAR